MYSLYILFFTLPLYFSHVFMHFGMVMGDSVSFERQKMYLFILCILLVLVEYIIRRPGEFIRGIMRYGILLGIFIFLPIVPILLFGSTVDIYMIRGSYEKFHGYLLYLSTVFLIFFLTLTLHHEKQKLLHLSLISVSIVSVVAILESVGISLFFPTQSGAWGEGLRTISTMGNPNYLAGYLLIMLPLTIYLRSPERWMLKFLITVALLTTGSYIGIGLGIMYGIYMSFEWLSSFRVRQSVSVIADEKSSIFRTFSDTFFRGCSTRDRDKRVRNDKIGNSLLLLITAIIAGGAIIFGYLYLPPDKLLSFTSRWVLMREVASQLVSYPLAFFIGFGPESILSFFMGLRSAVVDSYFPPLSLIDSSHNILLDIVFQYGIVPVLFIGWYMRRNWQILHPSARAGSILGILFLMGNPYVVVHIVLISFLLTYYDNRR